ncbi:hypothetical protein BGX38DRAFT_1317406 [Terfezia claveryi]|nr:hypothetical protein BGX38DRAFT_1317406 [Terfezia claveryi]
MASSSADVDAGSTEDAPINFTVKTSKDEKYTISLPPSTPISDLKSKLHELSQIEAGLQRLIYSGRVMKDEETLAFYKVQSGHTIHLVKGAASNQRASAGSVGGSGSSAASPGQTQAPRVPTNIAAGSGNNPLAGLTGARYAGLAPLPNADIFGPDGGMGPPPDPDQMYNMMSQPGFQATMNEMLQNPQMLEYIIESNPQLRSIPGAREMMRSPEFRAMMTNPEMMRQASEVQRRMGLGPLGGMRGGQSTFPAPGVTDTTPVQPGQQQQQQQQQGQQTSSSSPPVNPFAAGAGAGNPFAALFGAPTPSAAQGGQPLANPFASTNANPLNPTGAVDWNTLNDLMQHYNNMGTASGSLGSPGTSTAGLGSGARGIPPWLLPFMGGPGLGGLSAQPPAVDNRPPEERYAEQLRQLNDMGFFDFDRNIEALRRSGGSVQGAVEHLLGS